MKKVYLVSDNFDYNKTIAPDVGPEQAKRNEWKTDYLSNYSNHVGEWIIVDNRLTGEELSKVAKIVKEYRKNPFQFVIVDPFEEWCRGYSYYQFLFEICNKKNVFFLSKYTPDEVAEDVRQRAGYDKMVVVPYPYPEMQEVHISWSDKKDKIFFSGNQDANVYPYRHKFGNASKYWPPARSRVSKLQHPGYPDDGQEKKHNVTGDKYVERIAHHQFMFISPSRCHLEFLKYGECAAAGSVPVGAVPDGFNEAMANPFVELDFSSYFRLIRSIHRLFDMSEEERVDRAEAYREAVKKYRSPDRLNRRLDDFIEAVWD